MRRDIAILLDYSGTLSLDMPRFAARGNLLRMLKAAGLYELGVQSEELFWQHLVQPTLDDGLRGINTYERLLTDRLLRLFPKTTKDEVQMAVRRFVRRYFQNTKIHPHWLPFLRFSKGRGYLLVVTDHYQEATEAIIRSFKQAEIQAEPFAGSWIKDRILVANSADLRALKAEPDFWGKILKNCPREIAKLILVDDFGMLEAAGDVYRNNEAVKRRHEECIAAIRKYWKEELTVFPVSSAQSLKRVIHQLEEIWDSFS